MTYYLIVDSTNCSGFLKYGCGFRKTAYFWSNFEQYSVLGICLWNPKKRRRSKKSSKVADSATNLILASCEIRLQCTECIVWPRNVFRSFVSAAAVPRLQSDPALILQGAKKSTIVTSLKSCLPTCYGTSVKPSCRF